MRYVHCFRQIVLCALALVLAVGCSGDKSEKSADSGVDQAIEDDAPQGDDISGKCPAAEGPTEHSKQVTADETWTAAGSPHVITGGTTFSISAGTVTIEPCAVVEVGEGIKILVEKDGKIVAEGDEERPIVFQGSDGKTWGNLRVVHPAFVSLAHVVIQDGGDDVTTYDGASLVVWGDSEPPLKRVVKVTNVTVQGSSGYGALVNRWGGFTQDSSGLTITDSGAGKLADCHGTQSCSEPLVVGVNSAGSIPDGTYTGNAKDEILLDTNSGVETDVTLRDRGVPYHADSVSSGTLNVSRAASRPDDAVPTLTLEAGVEVRFDKDAVLRVGFNDTPGALVVNGTAEAPVRLTSSSASPAAGDWRGVWFDAPPATADNKIEQAVISFAGGEASGTGFSCPTQDGSGKIIDEAAAITFHYRPEEALVKNTQLVDSAHHGIVRGWTAEGGEEVDFTSEDAGNVFERVAFCTQTTPKPASGACDPQPCP